MDDGKSSSVSLHDNLESSYDLPHIITWKELDGLAYSLYGTLYIVITDILLYPADLITTRLQADKFTNQKGLSVTKYSLNILKKEGIKGFYRGFMPAMIGSFPGQFSYYVAYEYANDKLDSFFKSIPFLKGNSIILDGMLTHATSGLLAEMACGFAYLPTDIISQRLQIERKLDFRHVKFQHKNSIDVVKSIWKNEGFFGYFRGYYAYVLVYGPSSAVWWASYESFKKIFHISFNSMENVLNLSIPGKQSLNHLISGAIAGIFSVVVTNPLDVARTRIQLLETGNHKEKLELKQGFWQMLKNIVKNEGFAGLYKGMKPRIFVKIPGSAIAFLGYEWLKENSLNDTKNSIV